MTAVAVRLPNWVGDVIMALPALAHLHDHGLVVHCYGRGWAPGLLAALPYTCTALPKALFAAARHIRSGGQRHGIVLPDSLSSALQMRLAGIKPIGFRSDMRGILLSHAVTRPSGVHETQAFLTVTAAATGSAAPVDPPHPSLPLHPSWRETAGNLLRRHGVHGPYVVCCPLAAGSIDGRSKCWPHFAELGARLAQAGQAVVVCPGPGEEEAARRAMPEAVVVKDLELGPYASVMADAMAVVSNDSGPMHIAAAVGARVLGVFGVSDPQRTAPLGPHAEVLGDHHGWPDCDRVHLRLLRAIEEGTAEATPT